jgi:hypothetical protein
MELAEQLGYPKNIREAAKSLSIIYKSTGNDRLALKNYELYIQMRDSINNEANKKAAMRSQMKYEYDRQAAADSVAHAKESEIKNVELQRQKAELRAKEMQQYFLYGGMVLVLIFAQFMFNRYRVTQRQKGIIESQKREVEEQKNLVEEKQKEILDSIHYAKRIQQAHMPTEQYLMMHLKSGKKRQDLSI